MSESFREQIEAITADLPTDDPANGVNGMLYGFYEPDCPEAQRATIAALKALMRDNVTAFPYVANEPVAIRSIDLPDGTQPDIEPLTESWRDRPPLL